MMLIYESPEDFRARTGARQDALMGAWRAYHRALLEAGVYVTGAPLELPATGATVRVHGGQRHVQDGPYADTKEQLGGYIIIDVPSLDAALDWASRCPAAATGALELRAVSPTIRELVEGA